MELNFRPRKPYSTLTRMTGVTLGLTALAYASELFVLGLDLEISIVVGCLVLACLLVWWGWRWAPALGAVMALGIMLNNPWLAYNLTRPLTNVFFWAAAAQVGLSLITLGAGLGATVQAYWPKRRGQAV